MILSGIQRFLKLALAGVSTYLCVFFFFCLCRTFCVMISHVRKCAYHKLIQSFWKKACRKSLNKVWKDGFLFASFLADENAFSFFFFFSFEVKIWRWWQFVLFMWGFLYSYIFLWSTLSQVASEEWEWGSNKQ